jgi:hypothetical protein
MPLFSNELIDDEQEEEKEQQQETKNNHTHVDNCTATTCIDT